MLSAGNSSIFSSSALLLIFVCVDGILEGSEQAAPQVVLQCCNQPCRLAADRVLMDSEKRVGQRCADNGYLSVHTKDSMWSTTQLYSM